MTPRRARLRAALVGLPIALVVPLTACAGRPAASATDSSASGSSGASATKSGTQQRIEVTFAHGKATGNTGRVQVAKGTSVSLVVTSDVADEVHLHGYDIEQELSPGKPVTLQFDATITGVFEVELHKADTVLLRLQVS